MNLSDPIEQVKNIGAERAKKLHTLGIYTVEDMIQHFPREHEDRSSVKRICDLTAEEENTFVAEVHTAPENIRINGRILTKLQLKDETGILTAIWYNQPYLKNQFVVGHRYIFTGKLRNKYGRLQIESPEYEKADQGQVLSGGRIVPIYPATYKLSQKILRQIIQHVLKEIKSQLQDYLPKWVRQKYFLADRNFAIENIHFPTDQEGFLIARKRLVFEELFLLQLGLMQIKNMVSDRREGIRFTKASETQTLLEKLPFALTHAQQRVCQEIERDLTSGSIMNRLVQGDVGSGKTLIAILSVLMAVKNGYQAAVMVPTEVLAQQHFESFDSILHGFEIRTTLLIGSLTKKQKEKVQEEIAAGAVDVVIGTQALIQQNVSFQKLGIVITDEQHRFGVRQRAVLSEKGERPHILVMTATPIPRTLALILYGDLDISVIDEMPPGRQKIDTYSVPSSYHKRIYGFIQKEVNAGRQAYIICPMVEESEGQELAAVTAYTEVLKEELQGYTVEYLHGKMKPKEKQAIMDRFSDGEIQILVSTTVVEVGVNVPNATIMVVENAERFGLAQLHQLRGRVGRGQHKSYCILITDAKNKVATERMKVMERTNDGFELSEVDLKLRGPGEFFGTRQHGLPELRIANLYQDMPILKEAQEAVLELLKQDRSMEKEEHLLLKRRMEEMLTRHQQEIPL